MSEAPLVRIGKVRLRTAGRPLFTYVAAIDFDGTIHDPDDVEEGRRMGRPFRGAREVLRQLQEAGAKIIVHTCRARPGKGTHGGIEYHDATKYIEDWLRYYDIPFDEVTALKPIADVYIDDRAVRFEGDWDAIATDLLAGAYGAKRRQR